MTTHGCENRLNKQQKWQTLCKACNTWTETQSTTSNWTGNQTQPKQQPPAWVTYPPQIDKFDRWNATQRSNQEPSPPNRLATNSLPGHRDQGWQTYNNRQTTLNEVFTRQEIPIQNSRNITNNNNNALTQWMIYQMKSKTFGLDNRTQTNHCTQYLTCLGNAPQTNMT